ncbi:serine/threonine protein kinase [Pendulispora brunnea]|uniref:Serine/threonine protein kinase n=1 Tax=Pendulispora brunnea TaxID=2905690 RepID=A0ABZ2KL63_9BACT
MAPSSSGSSASKRALARIGSIVHECRIERLIGIGGMAAVYAGTREDGERVAIKFLLERFQDDPNMVRLFSQEANIANQVDHPGAVPVLDCSVDDDGCAFLIMPLLQGETVRARWERANLCLPVADAGVIVSDALDVLASAHARGIVHRDIKPENLFISTSGNLRVLDFGIARRCDRDGSVTMTGYMIGTPAFMSPEQALGAPNGVGPASDCWSAGATLFSLLSGQFVHDAATAGAQLASATRPPRSLADAAPHLPLSIVRFVDKALALDPKDRWPSARDMREALHEAFEGALNEPMEVTAPRVRGKFVAELAQKTEATRVKLPSRQSTRSRGPASQPLWMKYLQPDVEVSAFLPKFFDTMNATVRRILTEHGLGYYVETGWFIPDARPWWPMEAYVLALNAIAETLSPIKALDAGKRAAKYVELPPEPMMQNIHAMFESMDMAYHLNHRKNGVPMVDIESGRMEDGIGHYRYRGKLDTEQSVVMVCEEPYPCAMDHGMILGFARRFEPYAVVEHGPGGCRKDGAESCTYHITWW